MRKAHCQKCQNPPGRQLNNPRRPAFIIPGIIFLPAEK
jgi:hypothetical protein